MRGGIPMTTNRRYGDIPSSRQELEAKLIQSADRMEELTDWLYTHTADAGGAEYDRQLAAYHMEIRRYDTLDEELDRIDNPRKYWKEDLTLARVRNSEDRNRIKY